MHRLDLNDVIDHNPSEILAAAPDALALAMGAHVHAPHPFADAVARAPLRTAALAAGLLLNPRQPGENEIAVFGRGIRASQFAGAVAAGLQSAARVKYDMQAGYIAGVAQVEITKLGLPVPLGALDVVAPLEGVGDGMEYGIAPASLSDGESVTLSTYGRILGLTRQAIYNDEHALIQDAVAATGTAAARLEARLIAAALEGTGNMSDGSPVFHASHANVSAVAFDAAGLAAAVAAVRKQPAADGEALDAAAAVLFVAADLEYSAHKLVRDSGLPLAVVTLAGLAAGRYYVAASPDVARTIAVGRLEGATHPLRVEPVKTPISYDGAMVRVSIDTAAAMLGRRGIVRGG